MSFWPDRARVAMSLVVNVEEGAEVESRQKPIRLLDARQGGSSGD